MKTLNRKMIVFAAVSIIGASLAMRQNVAEGQTQPILAKRAANTAQVGDKQVDEARRQVDIARARAAATTTEPAATARAKSRATLPGTGFSVGYGSRWPFRSAGTTSVLVIPSADIEPKDLLTINEDLNVMSRIFETNLQKARITHAGNSVFLEPRAYGSVLNALQGRGRDSIQSLYLQGYGVLFLMRIDFPLSPLRQVQEPDETEKDEDGDKVWDEARRQLYEPEKTVRRKKDEASEKYDAEKVENLKTTIVEALKHAANIRNLQAEESVIITITGAGKSAAVGAITLKNDGKTTTSQIIVSDNERGLVKISEDVSLEDLGLSSPTILVIRAKKADIDSFAKGVLDLDEFRQRVQMISYPYLNAGSQRSDTIGYLMEDYVN